MAVFALTAVLLSQTPTITVSKEITYITEPRRADGTIDYLAYVNAPLKEIKPEDNAAVLLMKAVGPKHIYQKRREEFYRLLRMEPPPEKGDYLVNYLDYDWAKHKSTDEDRNDRIFKDGNYLQPKPWTRKDNPSLAEWIDSIAKPLELVKEASRRPRFYLPTVPPTDRRQIVQSDVLLKYVVYRECTFPLTQRVLLRAGEADLPGALDDLDACHCLIIIIGREPISLIESTAVLIMENRHLEAERMIAQCGKLSLEQLQRRRDWLDSQPQPGSSHDLLYRRIRCLDLIAALCISGVEAVWSKDDEAMMPTENIFGVKRSDFVALSKDKAKVVQVAEAGMREVNQHFNAIEELLHEKNYRRRMEVGRNLAAALEGYGAEWIFGEKKNRRKPNLNDPADIGRTIAKNWLVSFERTKEYWSEYPFECLAKRRQAVLAYALAAYKLRHKRYPEKLDAEELAVSPRTLIDPFNEKPFVYRLHDGNVQVLSVGKDEKLNDKPKPADVKSGRNIYTYNDDVILDMR